MSIRSRIGILNNDGTVTAIYCHRDGNLRINGDILAKHYQNEEKVKKLISNGDLSALYEKIEPNKDLGHTFDNPQEDVCIFFHRDRGEDFEETRAKTYSSIIDMYNELRNSWTEYFYVYIAGDWYYSDLGEDEKLKLRHLKSVIDEEE